MTSSKFPFYCLHCGSFDRRRRYSGGCRYFDNDPESFQTGVDPPCFFDDGDDASRARRRRRWVATIIAVVAAMGALAWLFS